ncbi:hypothetical protein CBS101457_006240 [Exobasidium rhododendri]|nr:hypothetical protein CBS101457_006240 [Exobasidium rhododendri]
MTDADSGFGQDQKTAVEKARLLATLVLEAPERFAKGDQQIVTESLVAMKAILDFAFHNEPDAIASLSKHLGPTMEESHSNKTRSGKGKKRKRGGLDADNRKSSLFGPTELDEMTVENVNEDQLWSQIELKNEKMNAFLDAAMVDANAVDEEQNLMDAEEEEADSVVGRGRKAKKERTMGVRGVGDEDEDDEDDLGALPNEKIVHSLKDLTDAELRSLGLDPSHREELEMMDAQDDDFFDNDGQEEDDDDDDKYGYAGASDLSDDDEMRGKVVFAPLRTEEQQRKRQAQVEREEREKALKRMQLRKLMKLDGDESDEEEDEDEEMLMSDEEEEEEDDDDDDIDYAGEGEEDEDEDDELDSEDSDEEDSSSKSERGRLSTLLDDLDAPGSNAKNGKKWKTHPTLDDAFFSIDQFNRDTDDYGDEGIDLGEDVDLFKPMEEEGEDETITYADFFAPPPGGTKEAKETSAGKKSDISVRPSTVRFHEEVSIRHIKASKKNDMDITPEMLRALQSGDGEEGIDDDEDGEEDGDDEDEDEVGEEDEDEEDEEHEDEEEEDEEDEEEVGDSEEITNDDKDEDVSEVESEQEQEIAVRVAGDLFAADEVEDGKSGKSQSNYERRLEKLQGEIARLEQENVTKKDWTLMGETGSRTRPENSLLAESLDYENNQKAKPIITEETTNTLEDLIRKRILASHFDDVERRANVQQMDFLPSKMLELSDVKSSRSLDQIYEDEMGMGGGGSEAHGEKMDKQLKQDHDEISQLYSELEYKLDAMSNAHFTPKPPKAVIQTISNLPTITLEESLPSTSNYASQLAPEEIYSAGRHNAALEGERSEMTPEEKKRLQRQLRGDKKARNERIESVKRNVEINKEAFAKNRGGKFVGSGRKGSRNDAKEKDEALHKLMGNRGVTVVGKGDANDTKKKRHRQQQDPASLNASHLKL